MPKIRPAMAGVPRFSVGARLRKSALLACASVGLMAAAPASSRADAVGAAFGAGTGLIVAGPPGAIVGGVVGAVWGTPVLGTAKQSALLLDR